MRLSLLITGWFVAAFFAGLLCGHALCCWIPGRTAIGFLFGRGRLLALVHDCGIYEQDVLRKAQELRFANGADEMIGSAEGMERGPILAGLAANKGIDYLARSEKISRLMIDRQYSLLQSQFRDRKAWAVALLENRFSPRLLRRQIAANSRDQRWIDRQLAGQINVRTEECRQQYQTNEGNYVEPIRFRASQLFLAAPSETQPDIVEAKRLSIEALSARIVRGENLAELVTLFSEDAATRMHGGDLGFFSEFRMPPEFIAPIRKMQVGETSPVIRTRLGFHIIQLTEFRGARQLSFDGARSEISFAVENEKRRRVAQRLMASASSQVDFVP